MTERCRTEPNAAEQSRTRPNAQRLLPIEAVAESDGAYLAAVREIDDLPRGVAAIVEWLIRDGRRDSGQKRLPLRTQRQLAKRLGLSVSTVCESLRRLQASGLVLQADGDYRLDLSLLVSISEESASRKAAERPPPDPAAALDLLSVRQRSACSACSADASVSVRQENTQPVSVRSESVSVSVRAGQPLPNAAEQAEHDDCLKDHHAWRALQTSDFRPELNVGKLRACFYAAVEAGLFDAGPDDEARTREQKVRFLATAWDLANSASVGKPAVCLRKRVERSACWRVSPEGTRWAKQWVYPEYAREPRTAEVASVGRQS